MTSLTNCFDIIRTGNREASRKAAREVRKLVYSFQDDRDKYEHIKSLISNAPAEYAKISEGWRQENFVMGISVMYFLHGKEKQPDFLFSWLLNLLQHENGYIRHAAVRMFENELGPLTYHIRFPNRKLDTLQDILPDQADRILVGLYMNLNNLAGDLWKPAYKKYKYIRSLPVGPYKSVQMVLGDLEEDCGEKYVKRLEQSLNLFKTDDMIEIKTPEDGLFESFATVGSLAGSKNGKLRYFVILSWEGKDKLDNARKKRLHDSAKETAETDKVAEIEKIEYENGYALLTVLISFEKAAEHFIDEMIIFTNKMDPFLRFHYFVTNTTKPNKNEIREYLESLK
jgi:hypothetical protein